MEMVRPDGIYLLHDTLQIYIYIGPNASHDLLQQLFPAVDPSLVPSIEVAQVRSPFPYLGMTNSAPARIRQTRQRLFHACLEHHRVAAG
jgi:hypothetical protein